MDKSWSILKNLELVKMHKLCNFNGCGKLPTREINIFEENMITGRRKGLVSLYLCSEHYKTELGPIVKTLRDASTKEIKIGKSVKDIGCITF
ncbi:MAG: hypothetical protein DRO99_01960 [Candidatus Aenigmatarchaeota archaeon]|nr:MAG: hypothetical protein DRO99_01960 [Candidatus Aenigmarchaeota archaeon]